MCRSIKLLNEPGQTATPEEFSSAALQFVRKISGYRKPSRANQEAFERAIQEIAESSKRLLEAAPKRTQASTSPRSQISEKTA